MSLAETYLIAAWKRGAPGADVSNGWRRGFWPDVARVAVEMALQETLDPDMGEWRQTACGREQASPPASKPKSRAENTAALLAKLRATSSESEGSA